MALFTWTSNPHRGRVRLLGAAAALALVAGVAFAVTFRAQPTVAQDEVEPWISGYVQFADILGEATEQDHKDWCEFLTFDQALFTPDTRAGAGSAASRTEFENILLVKPVDRASPFLQRAVANGKALPTVKIEFVRAIGGAGVFYSYELRNARITHYNVGTTGQSELTPRSLPRIELGGPTLSAGLLVEELSITFSWIEVTYAQLKPDGTYDASVSFAWDVTKNKEP